MENVKTVKGRIQHKHGTEADWYAAGTAATPFCPLEGELIVYDPDAIYSYPRTKYGVKDAEGNLIPVHLLPFANSGGITVDEELSMESSNPVQNKVISVALDSKLSTFQADEVSGGTGIYADQIMADIGQELYLGTLGDQVFISTGEGYVSFDEVNSKTIDKIMLIDAWAGEKTELAIEGIDGISWTEQFTLYDENQKALSSGDIALRVPFVAGDNVTFELDQENQAVKINATGGSTPQEYQIPTFDLTALGLPEVPLDGTQSSMAFDTNDIAVKLGEGPVKFIFAAMGTSISVIPSSIGVAGVWICTTNFDFNDMKMICTIGIEAGTAEAGGSIGVWFSSAIPVRGTDYWTEEDKAEIKAYVDDAILNGEW